VSSKWTGRRSRAVPLDQDDPRVIAAQQAERRLYDFYGLEPTHHPVALPPGVAGPPHRGRLRAAALLWGEHDPSGDVETGKRIAALVQHGRFQELPGGGHLPWLDDPETAGRLVMDLLRSTEHQ